MGNGCLHNVVGSLDKTVAEDTVLRAVEVEASVVVSRYAGVFSCPPALGVDNGIVCVPVGNKLFA